MNGDSDLAVVGSLLADRTRATILLTLLSGGLTSASALAERAGVSRPLASAHLRKLTEGGLIAVEPRGRQRLYRLSSQTVADALEGLILLAPAAPVRSLRDATAAEALRHGRFCYDHLAGRTGVWLTQGLIDHGHLIRREEVLDVTSDGAEAFRRLDIDVDALRSRPRPLTRACLDWSEGRPHLAGSLGAALAGELARRGWLKTSEASRVVALTEDGYRSLAEVFGLDRASSTKAAA